MLMALAAVPLALVLHRVQLAGAPQLTISLSGQEQKFFMVFPYG
jgi:hypothetical protein